MRKFLILTAAAVLALALAAVPKVAQADNLCGTTLATTTILSHSHDCGTGAGLSIGLIGMTLDLGGFVLKGDTGGSNIGVDNPGFDNVTVKNGVIEGFHVGVQATGVADFKLNNLTFTGQTDQFGRAVDILDSTSVKIRNSSFFMPAPEFLGSEAIRLQSVAVVDVKDVDVHGGFVGVNFACDVCNGLEDPTNGEVKDSVFHGTFIGVFLANTTDAKVEDNHMSGGVLISCTVATCGFLFDLPSKGILGQVTPKTPLANEGFTVVTNVTIEGNHVHDNDGFGIKLDGVTDSEVKNNEVHVNAMDGIALIEITEGVDPDIPSTGNEIKDNTSTGNGGFDISHDTNSTGNIWSGNTCESSSGTEAVADCP